MTPLDDLSTEAIECIALEILENLLVKSPTFAKLIGKNELYKMIVFTIVKRTIYILQYREVLGTGHLFPPKVN